MSDLISRQAAIDLFPNDALEWDTNGGYIAPHFARRMIEELPSAQPVRHGKWIIDPQSQYGFPLHIYLKRRCSECGHSVDNPTPYCPWCGAKMDEERKEE